MTTEFNRIITLLRKERGITQKQAAADLGVSQALLSHYEKGIRECGLDFVVRVAEYYDVSCDYLLGRSPDRNGLTLRVEDIPSPDAARDSIYRGSTLPTMNKKLISNSLNILYDKLGASQNSDLINEVSGYLSVAVYKMFRLMYSSNAKNASSLFSVSNGRWAGYSSAAMDTAEANVAAILAGEEVGSSAPMKDTSCFAMTSQSLEQDYRLYCGSLMRLIQNSEKRIDKQK